MDTPEYSTFIFNHNTPEFKSDWPNGQRIIIINNRNCLEQIMKKYPNAAFWGIKAFSKFIEYLKNTYDSEADRKTEFAQINTLKIVFGPGRVTPLIDEMDQRKYCAENQIDWKGFKNWMDEGIENIKIENERKPWRPFHGIKPKGWREEAEEKDRCPNRIVGALDPRHRGEP